MSHLALYVNLSVEWPEEVKRKLALAAKGCEVDM